MTKPIITRTMLVEKQACRDQLKLFDQHFPKGSVIVTVARCVKLAAVFNWTWCAEKLLTAPAEKEYLAATAPALKEYLAATAPAWKEYEAAMATAFALAFIKQTNSSDHD